jgi:hypothetical protein
MEALRNYLEKMGSTFLVASLIPSMAFVSITLLAFSPILPKSILSLFNQDENLFGPPWLTLLFSSVVLAFVLTSLNTFIHKVFEGYIFLRHFRFMSHRQKNRAQRLQNQIHRINRMIERKENLGINKSSKSLSNSIQRLKERKFDLLVSLEHDFPHSNTAILPTEYGNALRAAELYSVERYKLDALTIWPRLVYVIPEKHMSYVDQTNDRLSFLLNFSVLSVLFTCLSLIASVYQLISSILVSNGWKSPYSFFPLDESSNIYSDRAILYFAGGIITLGIAFTFHRASLLVVREYGNLIRSSIDLFRSQLLIELNQELPKNTIDEQRIWEKISDFFLLGERSSNSTYFEYHYRRSFE